MLLSADQERVAAARRRPNPGQGARRRSFPGDRPQDVTAAETLGRVPGQQAGAELGQVGRHAFGDRGGAGGSTFCLASSSARVEPLNGRRPVRAS